MNKTPPVGPTEPPIASEPIPPTPPPLPTPEVLETSYWRREGKMWHIRVTGVFGFGICRTIMGNHDPRDGRIYSSGYLDEYIKFRDDGNYPYTYDPLQAVPGTTLCRTCLEWLGLADFYCACEAAMMEESHE